jgi:predicted site-specific integrase-resolvase
MTERQENIVTPVSLSKELDIRPQVVFAWVRKGQVPSHKCVCGHIYLVRDEIAEFLTKREEKAAEKAALIEAELEEVAS